MKWYHDPKYYAWMRLMEALQRYVVGQTTKFDKKGREFISFSFQENKLGVKSLVVYVTKKGDLNILSNVTLETRSGNKHTKGFRYLLKNINEEEFFLICGKQRLGNHEKKHILDVIAQKHISSTAIYEEVMAEDELPY